MDFELFMKDTFNTDARKWYYNLSISFKNQKYVDKIFNSGNIYVECMLLRSWLNNFICKPLGKFVNTSDKTVVNNFNNILIETASIDDKFETINFTKNEWDNFIREKINKEKNEKITSCSGIQNHLWLNKHLPIEMGLKNIDYFPLFSEVFKRPREWGFISEVFNCLHRCWLATPEDLTVVVLDLIKVVKNV